MEDSGSALGLSGLPPGGRGALLVCESWGASPPPCRGGWREAPRRCWVLGRPPRCYACRCALSGRHNAWCYFVVSRAALDVHTHLCSTMQGALVALPVMGGSLGLRYGEEAPGGIGPGDGATQGASWRVPAWTIGRPLVTLTFLVLVLLGVDWLVQVNPFLALPCHVQSFRLTGDS